MDLTKTTYTINSIDKDLDGNDSKGNVCVTFDVDGKEQCLAGMPLNDAAALKAALSDYLVAYKSGLQQTDTAVNSDVTGLVGKKQTAEVQEA